LNIPRDKSLIVYTPGVAVAPNTTDPVTVVPQATPAASCYLLQMYEFQLNFL
jgi:hypothetical protein